MGNAAFLAQPQASRSRKRIYSQLEHTDIVRRVDDSMHLYTKLYCKIPFTLCSFFYVVRIVSTLLGSVSNTIQFTMKSMSHSASTVIVILKPYYKSSYQSGSVHAGYGIVNLFSGANSSRFTRY